LYIFVCWRGYGEARAIRAAWLSTDGIHVMILKDHTLLLLQIIIITGLQYRLLASTGDARHPPQIPLCFHKGFSDTAHATCDSAQDTVAMSGMKPSTGGMVYIL
jgi:hypothetical protein